MSITLYEVASEYLQLLDEADLLAEDNEGVIPDEMSDRLDSLKATRDQKIKNCVHAFKNISAEAEAIGNEKKALALREKRLNTQAEWLKGYIRYNIKEKEVFSTPTFEIKWRKSSSVEITDLEKVPLDLCKEFVKEPKLTEIKQAIKDGEDTSAYARIVEKQNMGIK
jgi:hypothetical protein